MTPSQDADAVVKLLTAQGDQLTTYARAGFKSKKRFGGALEPLLHVDFRAFHKPPSEMAYLEELQVRNEFSKLRTDFNVLSSAIYMAELSEHTSHAGLDNPELYNLLGNALLALEETQEQLRVICQFQLKLLSLMGWLGPVTSERASVYLSTPLRGSRSEPNSEGSDLRKLATDIQKEILGHLNHTTVKSAKFLSQI